MSFWSFTKATARRNDLRYPRRGNIRMLRTALLLAWSVIGLYASAVGTNLFGLLRQGVGHLTNRDALTHAFLLFDFLSDPKTSPFVLAPIALAVALIVAGSLWALRDVAIESAIRHVRAEQHHAFAETEQPDFDIPSLYIFSLEGDPSPRHVPLVHDVESVGRDTSNTIVLNDPRVSRKQMRIIKELYYWRVTCSRNSATLLINGQAQTNTILRPSDQLVVGTTVLSFTSPEPTTATAMLDLAPRLIVSTRYVNFSVGLRDPHIMLGRAPECGVVVPSDIISRKHAELIRTSDSAYEIRNLGAVNDLQFEGHAVSAHTLRDGDILTIGAGSDVEMVRVRYQVPHESQTVKVDVGLGKIGLITQVITTADDGA